MYVMDTINTAAKNGSVGMCGYGTVYLKQTVNGKIQMIIMKNVAYNPKLRTNLISNNLAKRAGIQFFDPAGTSKMEAWYTEEKKMW